jgi:hypothetical protein
MIMPMSQFEYNRYHILKYVNKADFSQSQCYSYGEHFIFIKFFVEFGMVSLFFPHTRSQDR